MANSLSNDWNQQFRSAHFRAAWGARYSTIATISDDEYICSTGCRIIAYRISDNKSAIIPHNQNIQFIYSFTLSPSRKSLAVIFRSKSPETSDHYAQYLLYDIASQWTSTPRSPRLISYPCKSSGSNQIEFRFVCLSFSGDSSYIAGITSHAGVGILLYDCINGSLLREIIMESLLTMVSFSPTDLNKLCVTGCDGTYQFWRMTSKTVNAAPIHGLKKSSRSYTCHAWINEHHVIAASSKGQLCLVQGCEHICSISYCSTDVDINLYPNTYISNILVRGDLVAAFTAGNIIYLLELKKTVSSNNQGSSATIVPLVTLRFTDFEHIYGAVWAIDDSRTSCEILLSGESLICKADLNASDYTQLVYVEGNSTSTTETSSKPRQFTIEKSTKFSSDIIDIRAKKVLNSFHSGSVVDTSVASRTCTIASISIDDESIRIRDYNNCSGSELVQECFRDRIDEIPLCICLHPSGGYVATGTEQYLFEYCVADTKLEPIRKYDMKTPFLSPNGTPFVNTSPVSLVRYANSGHLLAAVTGKIAQIFHLYSLDFSNLEKVLPSRVMVLADHSSSILDLVFSLDDTQLFTTSSDGSVYSWTFGDSSGRRGDYFSRGTPATKVVTNLTNLFSLNTIMATFETYQEATINNLSVKNRQASVRKNAVFSHKSLLSVSVKPQEQIGAVDSTKSSKSFLAVWNNEVTQNPEIIFFETPISDIALGNKFESGKRSEFVVFGTIDGRILISQLPLPTKSISSVGVSGKASVVSTSLQQGHGAVVILETTSQNSKETLPSVLQYLDESKMKCLTFHCGRIASVSVSPSGLWAFSAGVDGIIFMTSLVASSKQDSRDIQDYSCFTENNYTFSEKAQLMALRARMLEVDSIIDDTRKDNDRATQKLLDQKAVVIHDLETRMKREVQKRDDIIVKCNNDYARLSKLMKEEIESIRKKHAAKFSSAELSYERKLAQESLYLEKMKQAYDEYVVHARLDLKDSMNLADRRVGLVEDFQQQSNAELEKQKKALLLYVEFTKNQHEVILKSMEDDFSAENHLQKQKIKSLEAGLEDVQRQGRTDSVQLNLQMQRLRSEMSVKEEQAMKLTSDVDWSKGRIQKLELSLNQASGEIKKKMDAYEKLEYKFGEQHQQISELERIRKTLTSQLHILRQEIGPKEEKLMQMTDRLQEFDREYEVSLQALSEKESLLAKKGESMHLLQKQIKELRRQSANKEALLKRAAKLFVDYKFALRDAQFNSVKKTFTAFNTAAMPEARGDGTLFSDQQSHPSPQIQPNATDAPVPAIGTSSATEVSRALNSFEKGGHKNEVVEIISKTEGMDRALKGLDDLLKHFLGTDAIDIEVENEAILQREEQERHMLHLHKSVSGLKTNIEHVGLVANAKVHNHLKDNQLLLDEVNNLRHEIRSLSMENQRLLATIDFNERRWRASSSLQRSNTDETRNYHAQPERIEDNANDVTSLGTTSQATASITGQSPIFWDDHHSDEKPSHSAPRSKFPGENSGIKSKTLKSSKLSLSTNELFLLPISSFSQQTSTQIEDQSFVPGSAAKKKHPSSTSKLQLIPKLLGTASLELPKMKAPRNK